MRHGVLYCISYRKPLVFLHYTHFSFFAFQVVFLFLCGIEAGVSLSVWFLSLSLCPSPGADCDVDSAARFIAATFVSLNATPSKLIYHHFTTATDTSNIQVVFQVVMDMIIKENLEAVSLLWHSQRVRATSKGDLSGETDFTFIFYQRKIFNRTRWSSCQSILSISFFCTVLDSEQQHYFFEDLPVPFICPLSFSVCGGRTQRRWRFTVCPPLPRCRVHSCIPWCVFHSFITLSPLCVTPS